MCLLNSHSSVLTGIGIDDMFIMLSGLAGAQELFSVKDKMGQTLRTSGVSITITSLTDLLAFLAGASSSFLAVRNFCIYAGIQRFKLHLFLQICMCKMYENVFVYNF